jgi:hypothetical protein
MKVAHALSALPFLGILVGIFFANRTEPFVLGLPFALFWVTLWVLAQLNLGIVALVVNLIVMVSAATRGIVSTPSSGRRFERAEQVEWSTSR